MPLEPPILDRRTFDQIYEDALRQIPRYAPEWTDYNDSDPGITLLQFFSWLSEMILYELNRVPDRNYIKFLQLLDMELRPAVPAEAHLTFTAVPDVPLPPGAEAIVVPPKSQISAQAPEGGDPLIFETEAGLSLIRLPLTHVQVFDGAAFTDVTAANDVEETTFRPLGWTPQVSSALYLGFQPPQEPTPGRLFPRQIRFRVYLPLSAQLGAVQACLGAGQPAPPPVTLAWEYQPAETPTRWKRLNVHEDTTGAFTREGYILLEGPADIGPTENVGKVKEPRYWLRCRLVNGSYPNGREPEIDFIRPNTVPAKNLATVREEVLNQIDGVATSEGRPEQVFVLRHRPVQPGSLTLQTEIEDEGETEAVRIEEWHEVDDFLASGRDDRHYVLNANRGEVTFGNGERGRIPPAGATVVATEYRYGGGKIGNVGAGQINAPFTTLEGVDTVTNIRPAVGGRDEQTEEDLKERAPSQLRSRNRAVTAEDFSALANQAGGVAKAKALPLTHPDHPGVEVPGAITVIIVPDNKDVPPQPSPDHLRAVCGYLNQFRLLTTELYVKGPTYVRIKVETKVQARPYASLDAVAQNVKDALNEYLSPLGDRTADPDATGWDFGVGLYPTNLYGVILKVEDVAAVDSLELDVDGTPHTGLSDPVALPPDGLVYGADDHEIVVVPEKATARIR